MRPEPSYAQAIELPRDPLTHARLASALVSAFAAIDAAASDPQSTEEIRKAAIHLLCFLNQATFEGEIDLQEVVTFTAILLSEVFPHPFEEPCQPCQPCCDPYPPFQPTI